MGMANVGGLIGSFVVALLGAIALIWIVRKLKSA